jgi:hypothetical protein
MERRLSAWLTILAFVMCAAAAVDAYTVQETKAADVSGTWTLTVEGHGAHGAMSATLKMKQDAKKVTGRMAAHGREHDVSGEFVDGTLTLQIASESEDHQASLTGKLKDDGTMAGYLSGPMGDLKWTAERAKQQ